MEDTKNIRIAEYDYPLPDERIAKYPLERRDSSKLLVYRHGGISEDVFRNIASYLPKKAVMVFNNTKVIQARLHFNKSTGALIEVFCLEPAFPREYEQMFLRRGSCSWLCLVGNLKKWKDGVLERKIGFDATQLILRAERKENVGTSFLVEFTWEREDGKDAPTFAEVLDAVGELPIPPYLNRETEMSDLRTYQTVYSKIKGSVAAPTAGLHFTEDVLKAIDSMGIERQEVTLHVGAGTFKPVKSEHIGDHGMHTEHIAVRRSTIESLIAYGCKAIAVGTTSVRTLESLYYMGVIAARKPDASQDELCVPQWMPYEYKLEAGQLTSEEALRSLLSYMDAHQLEVLVSSTQIIIAPGYDFHIVSMMVTNFHQPKSTLLLLVSAFLHGDWRRVYEYALGNGFRFLSYGDSSLLIP